LIERVVHDALGGRELLVDALTEKRPLLEVGHQGEREESDRRERHQACDESGAKGHV
jgi:hypothetical protein